MEKIRNFLAKIQSFLQSLPVVDAMLNFIMGSFGTIVIIGGGQTAGAAFATSVIIGTVVSALSRVEYFKNGYPVRALRFSLLNTIAWTFGSALVIFYYYLGGRDADI
jgi:hypothetical protein